jgi:hypothetical protein
VTRPLLLGAMLGAIALLVACDRAADPTWHDAAGYRWRTLDVPRRGHAGFTPVNAERSGITAIY